MILEQHKKFPGGRYDGMPRSRNRDRNRRVKEGLQQACSRPAATDSTLLYGVKADRAPLLQ